MENKEYPLFDFDKGKKIEEKQTQAPSPENINKEVVSEKKQEQAEHYINALADRVAALRKKGESIISACEMVFNEERIPKSPKYIREKMRSKIGQILGRRGGEKAQRIKAHKKRHTVPKGKVFTPAQTEKMLEGSKAWQAEEEERAGQTYQESDLE